MRYAIISDIHGNLDALEAVLRAISDVGVDHIVCLGDIVGYGPDPGPCIDLVLRHNCTVVAGNHDFAVADKIDIGSFNVYARESTFWTRDALHEDAVQFLADLPLVAELDGFTAVHGTLHTPELFDYVQTCYDAYLSMQRMEQPVCFIGHSHVPIAFIQEKGTVTYSTAKTIPIKPENRTIVNVGSVGQPRDCNPRSAFAIYDTERGEVQIRRVRYDVDAVVGKIAEAGLPKPLGERLLVGR